MRVYVAYEQIGNLLSDEFALEISGNSSSGDLTGFCKFLKANSMLQRPEYHCRYL